MFVFVLNIIEQKGILIFNTVHIIATLVIQIINAHTHAVVVSGFRLHVVLVHMSLPTAFFFSFFL